MLEADAPVTLMDIEGACKDDSKKKLRGFKMVAYTGDKMNLGFGVPVVVDVSKMKAGQTLPILLNHDHTRIVGHTTTVTANAKTGKIAVEGVISAETPEAEMVTASSLNGFPWQASIGASSGRMQFVDKGATVKVNGRTFSGPCYVARGAQLGEVSFVALGADRKTSATVAASQERNVMGFYAWLEARGFDREELNEAQLSALRIAWETDIKASGYRPDGDEAVKIEAAGGKSGGKAPGKAPETAGTAPGAAGAQPAGHDGAAADGGDIAATLRATAAAEQRRINAVLEATVNHPELQAKAIEENWSPERAELEVLRAERPKAPAAHSHSVDFGDIEAQAMGVAIARSAGIHIDEKDYSDKVLSAADSARFKNAGIRTVMFETIRAAGRHARFDHVDNDVIRTALESDRALRAAGGGGGFSTIGLSGILSNVANKAMLAAYNAVDSVVSIICDETNTNDFKEFYRYRLVGVDKLEEVGPTGEIKHTSLQEQEWKNKVETYARMIALTREMMINDDLAAFAQIPRILGRAAALTRERAVFALLLANATAAETGNAFFSAGNKNYISGADTNLSIGGLTQLEQLFLDQVDPAGDPILVSPRILLVPTGLSVVANQLMRDTMVNETTAEGVPSPAGNPHAGKFRVVVSPYLNSQALTGSSSTGWYLLADPNDMAAIQVAYLRGRNTPVIESAETDFNTLGMQWRSYYDFGVANQDHRAACHSKGAA